MPERLDEQGKFHRSGGRKHLGKCQQLSAVEPRPGKHPGSGPARPDRIRWQYLLGCELEQRGLECFGRSHRIQSSCPRLRVYRFVARQVEQSLIQNGQAVVWPRKVPGSKERMLKGGVLPEG